MNVTSKEGAAERHYTPEASCKDSFRYRLVGENGRYRFMSVRFVGAEGCLSDDLKEIVMMLQDKWLDEVDVEALKRMECRGGRCRGCPQEAAKMISDIQEVLLPGERPRDRADADGRRLGRRPRGDREGEGGQSDREDSAGRQV